MSVVMPHRESFTRPAGSVLLAIGLALCGGCSSAPLEIVNETSLPIVVVASPAFKKNPFGAERSEWSYKTVVKAGSRWSTADSSEDERVPYIYKQSYGTAMVQMRILGTEGPWNNWQLFRLDEGDPARLVVRETEGGFVALERLKSGSLAIPELNPKVEFADEKPGANR